MLFTEVEEGTNLNLEVTSNGQVLHFHSKVLGLRNNKVMIEPVRIDNKILKLVSSQNLKVDILAVSNNKIPMLFENVYIETSKHLGKTIYLVTALRRGRKVNRRGATRMFLGVKGNIQLGINKSCFDVVVKDISQTGFAIATSRNIPNAVDTPIKLRFIDGKYKMEIVGRIVRKTIVEDRKIIYGCQLMINKDSYQEYVLEKEKAYIDDMKSEGGPHIDPKRRALMVALKER